jgi:Protein of unknown function (DUF1353)
MNVVNRRGALKMCLSLSGLVIQTGAMAQSEQTPPPVSKTVWLDLAARNKSIDSPLYLGRFREPIYFLVEPISWTPQFIQASKLTNVTVPKGFVTDLASIPPLFYSYLRPDGIYAYAAIIHDYLYWEQTVPKAQADDTLKAAMQDLKVDPVRIELIHRAVSLAGMEAWNQNKKLKEQGEQRYLEMFPSTAGISWEDWKKREGVFRRTK